MNFHIYGRPFFNHAHELVQQRISIDALKPFSHFRPYPYCDVHTSERPRHIAPSQFCNNVNGYTEQLLRVRRVIAFADASRLNPQDFPNGRPKKFIDKIEIAAICDHRSIWMSDGGAVFYLLELYGRLEREHESLMKAGLIFAEVPVNLAPYGGGWNSDPGALPLSRSYLICDQEHAAELEAVRQRLQAVAELAPRWNDTTGVNCELINPAPARKGGRP